MSRDVLALVADERVAAVQLFQMRAGKLVGRLGFTADAIGMPAAEEGSGGDLPPSPERAAALGRVLQTVVEEHYSQVEPVEIPPQLLLQVPLPQQGLIEEWLSELRGRKVKLAVPQRSQKADLIDLVQRNASYELERARRASEQNLLATEDLAQLLELPSPPRRIEGYDISHIQGSDAVASQVVFIDGLPAKQHYRKYKIQSSSIRAGHSDDFMAMA